VLLTGAGNYFDCPQERCSMLQIHHLSTQFTLNHIHQRQFWYHTLSTINKQLQYSCIKMIHKRKNHQIYQMCWNDVTILWCGWKHHFNQLEDDFNALGMVCLRNVDDILWPWTDNLIGSSAADFYQNCSRRSWDTVVTISVWTNEGTDRWTQRMDSPKA